MKTTKEIVLAGQFTFTVEPSAEWVAAHPGRKPHYTYRIEKSRDGKAFFVYAFVGKDNSVKTHYHYLGLLRVQTGEVILTGASRFRNDEDAVNMIRKVLACVWANQTAKIENAGWNLHHEGQCCRCGKALTVPASIETGIGPECEQLLKIESEVREILDCDVKHVPYMHDRTVARLQYSYWMFGDEGALSAINDALQDAGESVERAEGFAHCTRLTMRHFKKGKRLSQEFKALAKM